MAEWVYEVLDDPNYALVGGYSYACQLCYYGTNCYACIMDDPFDADAIEALSQCPLWDTLWGQNLPQRAYPKQQIWPYLGTRCCYDGP